MARIISRRGQLQQCPPRWQRQQRLHDSSTAKHNSNSTARRVLAEQSFAEGLWGRRLNGISTTSRVAMPGAVARAQALGPSPSGGPRFIPGRAIMIWYYAKVLHTLVVRNLHWARQCQWDRCAFRPLIKR